MTSELITTEENAAHPALSFGPFLVTPIGLIIDSEPTWDEWQQLYDSIVRIEDFSNWTIGDAEAYTRAKYGEAQAQLLARWPDYEYERLRHARWVAERVEFGTRVPNLSWSHHREVAHLPTEQQSIWLQQTKQEGLSHRDLRQRIRSARLENVNAIAIDGKVRLIQGDMLNVLPTLGKFDLVVTDPPYGVLPSYDSIRPLEWDAFANFIEECRGWLVVLKDALADNYNLFLFTASEHASQVEALFVELDLPIQSRIIWHRRSLAKGRHSEYAFLQTWDMVLHAGNRQLNFPADWSDAWFDVQVFAQPMTSSKGIDQKIHETQKPEGLIRRLVEFGSFPGDRVLDPFAGSGVVGAVCPADRDCVLVEMNVEYAKRIATRLGI